MLVTHSLSTSITPKFNTHDLWQIERIFKNLWPLVHRMAKLRNRILCPMEPVSTHIFPFNFVALLQTVFRRLFLLGCALFPEMLQNFCQRQILWSLCSVVLHWNCLFKIHFLWRLNSQFLWVHMENVQISGKRAHPSILSIKHFNIFFGCIRIIWDSLQNKSIY